MSSHDLSGINNFYHLQIAYSNLDNVPFPVDPDLRDIEAAGTTLTNLDLSGGNLSGSHLVGADFTGTDLTNVIWADPSESTTVCPGETNAQDHGNTCIGHL